MKILKLPNIGRESNTYLEHIIQNYDNLTEYNIFIQDDVNNHIPNLNNFIDILDSHIRNNSDFYYIPTTWRDGKGACIQRVVTNGYVNLHTMPRKDIIKDFCKTFNIDLPNVYNTYTCAFLFCSKKRILKNSKEFYIKLNEYILDDSKEPIVESPNAKGFIFEHIWSLIFK